MTEQESVVVERILKVLHYDFNTTALIRLKNLIRANTASAAHMFVKETLAIPIVMASLENLTDGQIETVMTAILERLRAE